MRGDAVLEGVVEDLGDILVAVVGVKEIEAPILGAHDERARGDRLGGIPHKFGADGVAVVGIQPLDAEEVVVDKAEVRGNLPGSGSAWQPARRASLDTPRGGQGGRRPS